MSTTAIDVVQQAFYERLTGTRARALQALVQGVFDAVPDKEPFPYIVIGDGIETPDRTFGQNGHNISALVTIFTRDGEADRSGDSKAGFAQGLAIAKEVTELLTDDEDPLLIAGHDLVDCDVDSTETLRDDDDTRRIEVRLHVWLEDNDDA